MTLKNTGLWIKNQYDKLIAFVVLLGLLASLLYLAVNVGMIQRIQSQFDREIHTIVPKYENALEIDATPYKKAREAILKPFQILYEQWTNAMPFSIFVPETRVWCVDCRRPIPYESEVCPFCDVQQPEDPDKQPTYDGDKDGLYDVWEKQYGLDPFDPADAGLDNDNDGFTNIDEFRAKTDPNDNKDYPPIEVLIKTVKITADPFKLRFKSVLKLPDGSLKFAINTRGNKRTYFKKMGEEVEGFILHKYERKSKNTTQGGIKRSLDVSVLTLMRGKKLISLIKGRNVQYNEFVAHLIFLLDKTPYTLRIGENFELKDKKYKLKSVDRRSVSVVIIRVHDGKRFTIHKIRKELSEDSL